MSGHCWLRGWQPVPTVWMLKGIENLHLRCVFDSGGSPPDPGKYGTALKERRYAGILHGCGTRKRIVRTAMKVAAGAVRRIRLFMVRHGCFYVVRQQEWTWSNRRCAAR